VRGVEKAAKHPIAEFVGEAGKLIMLKRARISMALAAVPAALFYSRFIDFLIPIARFLFWALIGFSVVSFLFAMFEDEPVPETAKKQAPAPVPQAGSLALAHTGHSS